MSGRDGESKQNLRNSKKVSKHKDAVKSVKKEAIPKKTNKTDPDSKRSLFELLLLTRVTLQPFLTEIFSIGGTVEDSEKVLKCIDQLKELLSEFQSENVETEGQLFEYLLGRLEEFENESNKEFSGIKPSQQFSNITSDMFKIVKKMQKDRSSSKTKKESTESETNPEIFNDDDFYKSLILKGIKKIDDSVELSQEFEGSLSKSSHFGSKKFSK